MPSPLTFIICVEFISKALLQPSDTILYWAGLPGNKPNLSYFYRLFKNFYKIVDFISFSNNKKINLNKIFLGSSHVNKNKVYTLENIYEEKKLKDKNFFLKIDIEGSEYRILDDIIKYKKNITGLIIEFHDVDLHLDRILKFIADFEKNIAHIHANNYSIKEFSQFPEAIELTFSKKTLHTISKSNDKQYPLKGLDYPNSKRSPDVKISFNK
mgnify:CR=1 FL=1